MANQNISGTKYLECLTEPLPEEVENMDILESKERPTSIYWYEDEDKAMQVFPHEMCYAELYYAKLSQLYLYWHKELVTPEIGLYMDYIINRSPYAHAFETKKLEDGFKHGFKMNMQAGRNMILAAGCWCRFPLEHISYGYIGKDDFTWTPFLDMGFTEDQAFFLCLKYYLCGDTVKHYMVMENHMPVQNEVGFKDFINVYDNDPNYVFGDGVWGIGAFLSTSYAKETYDIPRGGPVEDFVESCKEYFKGET